VCSIQSQPLEHGKPAFAALPQRADAAPLWQPPRAMAAVEPTRRHHQDDLRSPCRRLCNRASTVVLKLYYWLLCMLNNETTFHSVCDQSLSDRPVGESILIQLVVHEV